MTISFSLQEPVHSDLLIKKSRFIGCVQPVPDRATAVAALREQHPGARHVCWALMAGGQSAANDDGEPGGTAGRPMLEVLRHQQLEGVLATVVRYFGGVKLGAGGLVRAYTDAVAQALQNAVKVPRELRRTLVCDVPYAFEGWLRRELDAAGATLLEARHEARVRMTFNLPAAQADALVARLDDAGHGRVTWPAVPDGPEGELGAATASAAPQRRQ